MDLNLKHTMMKLLQLYKDGKELIGSDGIMYVDGRFSLDSINREVKARNDRYRKNFPHCVANAWSILNRSYVKSTQRIYKIY